MPYFVNLPATFKGENCGGWILGPLVLISGGKTNFIWLVSGVLRAGGWLWGSNGGLLRNWDPYTRRRGEGDTTGIPLVRRLSSIRSVYTIHYENAPDKPLTCRFVYAGLYEAIDII